jgi:ABC-type bacteriocin/lantibiotic exporter with double-glycine peptidase domain
MVISGFGLEVDESELRYLCDCTFDGTSALKAMDAARALGFTNTTKQTLTINELETIVAGGQYPIVFVDMTPIDAGYVAHALVVISVSDLIVQVIDPEKGERFLSRQKFHEGWKNRHRLAIIVEK